MSYISGTMRDIAALQGRDKVVDILDLVKGAFPELDTLIGRTIVGTTFKVTVVDDHPQGGFHAVNYGVQAGNPRLFEKFVQAFRYDNPIVAPVAVAEAHEDGAADYLRIRSASHTKGAKQLLGSKVWYGSAAEGSVEMPGFQAYTDASYRVYKAEKVSNPEQYRTVVDAGGTTANKCASVYLVYQDIADGASLLFGQGKGMDVGSFVRQFFPVVNPEDNSTGITEAFVASLGMWIGLQCLHPAAAIRIANIDATHGLTDKLLSAAFARLPEAFQGQKGKLKIFANKAQLEQLQQARTAILNGATNGPSTGYKNGQVAAWPEEFQGIPIVTTSSLKTTEPVEANAD